MLDYSAATHPTPEAAAAFRRQRIIYIVGVCVLWAVHLSVLANRSHLSDGMANAGNVVVMQVTGWAALAWLLIGLRRILLSRPLRHSVWVWLFVIANAIAAAPVLF